MLKIPLKWSWRALRIYSSLLSFIISSLTKYLLPSYPLLSSPLFTLIFPSFLSPMLHLFIPAYLPSSLLFFLSPSLPYYSFPLLRFLTHQFNLFLFFSSTNLSSPVIITTTLTTTTTTSTTIYNQSQHLIFSPSIFSPLSRTLHYKHSRWPML